MLASTWYPEANGSTCSEQIGMFCDMLNTSFTYFSFVSRELSKIFPLRVPSKMLYSRNRQPLPLPCTAPFPPGGSIPPTQSCTPKNASAPPPSTSTNAGSTGPPKRSRSICGCPLGR